jgi:hypothetical protein
MRRLNPPPLATWILERCTPGQRDQALAGDLLEEFQRGRSHGWYWRQCLAACLVGWVRYLGNRSSLIAFATLWSMLAPAWSMLVDRVQYRSVAWPAEVAAWLGLNLVFIWTGMLLFATLHRRFAAPFAAKKLLRALAVAAGVFLPLYFATSVLANLFAWPGLAAAQRYHGASPLAEIADLRLWADTLRIPYFVTFLWSLWSIAPLMAVAPVAVVEWSSSQSTAPGDLAVEPIPHDPARLHRMLLIMVATGLLNALIAGFLLCHLPAAHHPTLQSLLTRAALYVVLGAVTGIIGTYLYWHNPASSFRDHPPLPFSLFALVCAAGWVWVPAMILFSEQVSALTAAVALVAAFLLAGEIRRISLLILPPLTDSNSPPADSTLFAESLYRAPAEPDGYLLALCLYAAGWAIVERSNFTAAALLAFAACLFKLKTTFLPPRSFQRTREYRRAALRLTCLALPAILVTFWALLEGVAHRNGMADLALAEAGSAKSSGSPAQSKNEDKSSTHLGSGYESVVLWPYPPKKEIVSPVPPAALLAPGTTQPVVIRFNGEYWYLQPPDQRPGPTAHRANGNPLDVHIASSNSFPLMMQAHQYLSSPVRVARCREVRIEIESRETDPTPIALAVWLKNSASADAPAVYLGEQPMASVGLTKASPATETLVFAVPTSRIRTFDEIAIMLLPDSGHQRVGPRIAIRQFELVPR